MTGKLIKPKFKAFRVGPLPANMINAALGTELDSADVWVSKKAHEHIALDHPDDYEAVKANIIEIIRSPTWAGQDPKQGGNFYLVRRVQRGEGMQPLLIAIGLEPSEHGTYNVRTGYAISEQDILTRRLRGSLHALYLK
ncbi:hypothetical protein DAH55_05785 [Sphingomonas koreensis]|uniref:PBECR3 domain-containing polyvalent protein n=1 Tax=Sphingomonas koreensis TaxID=93064 RepID=UPI00082D39E3|nr:hypothetical protein [Sphingomonas koreensis]PJI89814.1 hypothetical protein BDW16_3134 [Sphingomonas koreensis]RSU61926.1 hypothetical protein DAH56_06365 [Sphingomonas koreensis]RSU70580.1 hypothetical protein DAH55_05785 [Sphingomonas koreensis]